MNKKTIKVAGWALGLSMAVAGIGVIAGGTKAPVEAKAAVTAGDKFERISSISDISDGDEIIFVNQAETYSCGTTQNKNNRTAVSITTSSNSYTYSSSDSVQVFTVKTATSSNTTIYGFYTGSGYIYSASSSSNYLKTNTTAATTAPSGTSAWTLSVSDNVFTVKNVSNTSYYLAFNISGNTTLFSQYAQNMVKPYIYKKANTTQSISINSSSVSGLKGDTDSSTLSITAQNFTPTDISVTYSVDDIATVSKGAISDKTIPLNVAFGAIGSTKATISVSGGSETYSVDLDITVAAKPASITISPKANTPWVDGKLEVRTGGNGNSGYKEVVVAALDTDGNEYTGDLTWESSDESIVKFSDSKRIYGVGAGEATITVKAAALESVSATLNVKVFDDYHTGVSSVTYNANLTADAGDTLNITDIFATKVASTYFGSTDTLDDDELLFSYSEDDYENAVEAQYFTFVCDDGTEVGQTEAQTVYVYSPLDENWSSSFSITVTKTNVALSTLTMSNVTSHALNLNRNKTFQIELSYDPNNATDKRVSYSIDSENSDANHGITVSSTGLITASSSIGKKARVVVTSVADDTKSDYVDVTVTRETQTFDVVNPLTIDRITSTDDLSDGKYLIVYETDGVAFDGSRANGTNDKIDAGNNVVSGIEFDGTSISNVEDVESSYVTISAVDGGYTVQTASGYYIGRTATNNGMDVNDETAYVNAISFSSNNVVIQGKDGNTGYNYLRFNSNTGTGNYRFRYYASTSQQAIQLYKFNGGEDTIEISDDLYNAVINAESNIVCDGENGTSSLYDWDEVKDSFGTTVGDNYTLTYTDLTYGVAKAAIEGGNEVEEFLAKYDYMVGKYGLDDFLSRSDKDVFSYQPAGSIVVGAIGDSNNAATFIAITAGLGALAAGGYFFLRKRKEQ